MAYKWLILTMLILILASVYKVDDTWIVVFAMIVSALLLYIVHQIDKREVQ